MALTKEKIIAAAEELKTQGVNPSMDAVRKHLGGGSFATISPVLRDWRQAQEDHTATVLGMPAEMKAATERAGAELWRVASRIAGDRLEQVRSEAENAVKEAQAERDEALTEIQRLEQELERTVNAVEQAAKRAKRAEEAEAGLVKAGTEIAALNARLDDRSREIEDHKARISKLDAKNDHLQSELVEIAKRKQDKSG